MDERIEKAKQMFMSALTTSVDIMCSELAKQPIESHITADNIFDTLAVSMLYTIQDFTNKLGLDERSE